MQVVRLMYLELKDVAEEGLEEAMENYILCYDNMCQLDSLKAPKEDLTLPPPFHAIWRNIKKIIDRLHLANHKNPKCKRCTVPMKPFLLDTTPWWQNKHSLGFHDSRKLPIPCHRLITYSSFIGTSNAETHTLQNAEGKARNLFSQESTLSSYQNCHK